MEQDEVPIDTVGSRLDEYARANGLTVDSQVDIFPLLARFRERSLHLLFPPSDVGESADSIPIPSLPIPPLTPGTEQLSIPKDSLELLRSAASVEAIDTEKLSQASFASFAGLKLETPLLRNDPEYDCRELARSVRERRRVDIDVTKIPSEPLNPQLDQALTFPDTAFQYREGLERETRGEMLDVPRQALLHLSRAMKDTWCDDNLQEFFDEIDVPCRKHRQDLAITPPLSPIDRDEGYFVPDDDTCEVPVSSDVSTLLDTDLDRVEADIFRQDACDVAIPSPLRLTTTARSPSEEVPLLAPQYRSLRSLKLEGKLTPVDSFCASELAIDTPRFIQGVDIDQVLATDQSDPSNTEGEDRGDAIFSDETLGVFHERATDVKRRVEQEYLQTADATARVEVPALDYSIPKPDWQNISLDPASQLAWIKETCKTFAVAPWPKDSQAENRLRWAPFAYKMSRFSAREFIDDAGTIEELLGPVNLDKVPTSADYVWKYPGLAILRDPEEGEDELDPPPTDQENSRSLDSLLRKRRAELSNPDPGPDRSRGSASPIELVKVTENTAPTILASSSSQAPSLLLGCSDPFATSTLLSNYVEFHPSKRRRKMKRPPSAKSKAAADQMSSIRASIESQAPPTPGINLEKRAPAPAPIPELERTPPPTKIVKALTLERGIFSRLEKLYPNARIIERDFDRWNTLAWGRNSVVRSPLVSPLAAEADIIASPTTGIMVTTLLKAIQKPVPCDNGNKGKAGLAAIRERVRSVALRYERLIILVSEANRIDEAARNLTASECAGYTDFVGFVTGLDTGAQVYYVGGGNETLASWLVAILMRHAPEAATVEDTLIQGETLWELFLRRAGLNAFAAQAILGRLRPPDDVPEEDHEAGRYGLSAFVRMTSEERVREFRDLMGGERVLQRVNKVLETKWSN
ncbi:hypothetical protein GGS23DRAFT_593543 [Durotheca rogersii]|uniref:uncharacterized protein n=1 Tax=Durotheca rogersii TaxID=419775 RepID=UPI00221F37EB|nr:uncharacterized protein GGS23DRAFT_593543 [Durotheca rogersii]KAI5866809.1 hypothetical protein GGS23DRAFT_593543 [Durotheca rogersii]